MADRLTQLQDAVDELALQFVASLVWVNKHHDLVRVGKNDVVRKETKNGEGAPKVVEDVDPLPEDQFKDGQLELARDLILKEQQIESLISVLPGLETSEKDQVETIQRLEQELKEEESRRKQALKEKEVILEKLESVIRSVKRP
ncbi:RNA polymerase II mediator complex subunit [Clarireedia jacksonii]